MRTFNRVIWMIALMAAGACLAHYKSADPNITQGAQLFGFALVVAGPLAFGARTGMLGKRRYYRREG